MFEIYKIQYEHKHELYFPKSCDKVEDNITLQIFFKILEYCLYIFIFGVLILNGEILD